MTVVNRDVCAGLRHVKMNSKRVTGVRAITYSDSVLPRRRCAMGGAGVRAHTEVAVRVVTPLMAL